MPLRTIVAVLVSSLLASACVIVPVTVEGFDPECRLVVHPMELQTVQVGRGVCADIQHATV